MNKGVWYGGIADKQNDMVELMPLMIEDCDSLCLDVIHNIFWWFMLIMGGWAMLLMIDLGCFRKQINFSLLKLLTLNDVN